MQRKSYKSPAQKAAIRAAYARRNSYTPSGRSPQLAGYGSYRKKYKNYKRAYQNSQGYIAPAKEGDKFSGNLGRRLGGDLGELAQGVAKIFGFGDYDVESNSILDQMKGVQTPKVVNSTQGDRVIVRHKEFLGDISSSVLFDMQRSLSLNPGLPETFPWLSAVAQCFEKYRFRGLLFHYRSTACDALNSTNFAMGTVVFSTYYNSHTPPPQDKQTLEAAEYSSSCKPSVDMIHPIECAQSLSPLREWYVRSGPVPSGADQLNYDLGTTYLATVGSQAAAVAGELWVTYEVELIHAIMPPSQGIIQTDHWQLQASTISSSNPLSTGATLVTESNLGTTINPTGTVLSFPPGLQQGSYLWVWTIHGVSTALGGAPVITFTNCTYVPIWSGDSGSNISNQNTTATIWIMVGVVNLSGTEATMSFATTGTYPSSVNFGDLVITSFNAEITTLVQSIINKKKSRVVVVDDSSKQDTESDAEEDLGQLLALAKKAKSTRK